LFGSRENDTPSAVLCKGLLSLRDNSGSFSSRSIGQPDSSVVATLTGLLRRLILDTFGMSVLGIPTFCIGTFGTDTGVLSYEISDLFGDDEMKRTGKKLVV
jgi:hypothetical protein